MKQPILNNNMFQGSMFPQQELKKPSPIPDPIPVSNPNPVRIDLKKNLKTEDLLAALSINSPTIEENNRVQNGDDLNSITPPLSLSNPYQSLNPI